MDLVLATCQGIGLALASGAIAGALAGAFGSRGSTVPGAVLIVIGAIAGAYLLGEFLTHEDHPAWPGLPLGALIALLAAYVAREIVAGAAARTEGASAGTLAAYVILAAAAVAGLSLVLPPVGLVALLVIAWLAISRRRRAAQKHEGLRVLR
jgi:hypothetical protein